MDVGSGYRELDPWEQVQIHYEVREFERWRPVGVNPPRLLIGAAYSELNPPRLLIGAAYSEWKKFGWTIRVPVEVPGAYPPLSQEAKDSMAQFHEDALEMLDRVVAVPQDIKETEHTYTLSQVKASMFPATDFAKHVAASSKEDLLPTKSFTPNKYTRWMPTLDGRKVPVDVYCVLAAFPTGSAAVDHAVKKQLAPGQRGHKDRIQDLKEARDSLTRAIELEEAVEG